MKDVPTLPECDILMGANHPCRIISLEEGIGHECVLTVPRALWEQGELCNMSKLDMEVLGKWIP